MLIPVVHALLILPSNYLVNSSIAINVNEDCIVYCNILADHPKYRPLIPYIFFICFAVSRNDCPLYC